QLVDGVGRDRLSRGAAARRLREAGVPTRLGQPRWDRGTLGARLHHPIQPTRELPPPAGRAAGTRSGPWQRHTRRPLRAKSAHPRPPPTNPPVAPPDWITLAVPPVVDTTLVAAVQAQLRENKCRARTRERGAH